MQGSRVSACFPAALLLHEHGVGKEARVAHLQTKEAWLLLQL
jgi:hypothetical protein